MNAILNIMVIIFITIGAITTIFAYKPLFINEQKNEYNDEIQDYNDKVQTKRFCSSLTPQFINNLNKIEEK